MQGNWAAKGAALLFLLLVGCAGAGPGRPGAARPDAIRATAIVEIRGPSGKESVKGRAVITAERPDLFRIEVKDPFLRPVAIVVSDGESIKFVGGPAFGGPFRLPVDAGRLVSLLLGDPLMKARTTVSGPEWTATLSDIRRPEDMEIPFSITLTSERGSIVIRYVNVEINPRITKESFVLPPEP